MSVILGPNTFNPKDWGDQVERAMNNLEKLGLLTLDYHGIKLVRTPGLLAAFVDALSEVQIPKQKIVYERAALPTRENI